MLSWKHLQGSQCMLLEEDTHNVPMQWTNLTDKAGTEIYEGDVVEFEESSLRAGLQGEVRFNPNAGVYYIHIKNHGIERLGFYSNAVKVIGNIYEQTTV